MIKPVLNSAGLVAVALAVFNLSACSTAQTHKVDDETYYLTEYYSEPLTDFESWALRRQAKELCPTGYDYLLRKAGKPSEFAKQHFQCLGEKDCSYALEWRIRCVERPEEKFSIFGRT
ncbi:hypothetical protein QCB44_05500 [Thiomicrorhabdus sp. zzn3]|uniref:hypothetical protein n=1 Tax=Thiomicrorhabdus sp. zzn3 TaxID=3039775 RepID=UPI00243704B7|nr:hypothetical protein [Thiomicrorhabdus sp. zzn3]MDG6778156.1 hypothetical protein [Thiomicrorhabdus sp. zzn3]